MLGDMIGVQPWEPGGEDIPQAPAEEYENKPVRGHKGCSGWGDQCGQKLEGGENKAVFPDLGVVERRGLGETGQTMKSRLHPGAIGRQGRCVDPILLCWALGGSFLRRQHPAGCSYLLGTSQSSFI